LTLLGYTAQRGSAFQPELAVELVNATAGIDQFLLAREKGVTLGADFDLNILFGGAGLDDLPARAFYRGLLIVGMDAFFHLPVHLSPDGIRGGRGKRRASIATKRILTQIASLCKCFLQFI
jgi:hypothetical protein